MNKIKVFSMFSGIGGFEKGMQDSGIPFETVGYSEIDKFAIQVYENHFKGIKNYGDATRIDTSELPNFDLLACGFPCQAFSVAGLQKGFDDTRGTLFFEVARILRDKKPKCFLLENVKGLISHDSGHSFKRILGVCSDLGYDIEWEVLNSKDFGVPQNRERIFIVGYLADGRGGGRKIFPITSSHTENDIKIVGSTGWQKGAVLDTDGVSTSLTATDYKQPKQIKVEGTLDQQDVRGHDILRRVYGAKGLSPTIPTGMGGNTMPKVALKIDRKGKIKKDQNVASALTVGGHGHGNHSDMDLIVTPVLTPDRETKRQNGRRFKEDGDPSFTLTAQDVHGIKIERKPKTIRSSGNKDGSRYYYEDEITQTISANPTSDNLPMVKSPRKPKILDASHRNEGIRVYEDYSPTLNSRDYKEPRCVQEDTRIRRLTPTECSRLQGFPDTWVDGLSDSQKYKTLGNSVTTNVICAIFTRMYS